MNRKIALVSKSLQTVWETNTVPLNQCAHTRWGCVPQTSATVHCCRNFCHICEIAELSCTSVFYISLVLFN